MLFCLDILLLKEMWWAVQMSVLHMFLWHVQQQMFVHVLGQSLTNNNFYKHQHNTPFWQSNSWGGNTQGVFFSFFWRCGISIAGLANDIACSLILWLTLISIHSFETPVFVWWLNHLNTWAHPRKKNYDKKSISLIFRPTYYLEATKNHKLHPGPRWNIIKKDDLRLGQAVWQDAQANIKKGRRWPYPLKKGCGLWWDSNQRNWGCKNMGEIILPEFSLKWYHLPFFPHQNPCFFRGLVRLENADLLIDTFPFLGLINLLSTIW